MSACDKCATGRTRMRISNAIEFLKEKRQRTAALQEAVAMEGLPILPRGFGVRLSSAAFTSDSRALTGFLAALRQKPELVFFIFLILVFNAPVLFGGYWSSMMFQPDAVRNGEWWRLLTHPFVHLTWYHLLLDGTAFLSLYWSIVEKRILVRLAYVVSAGTGSLIASWVTSPAISTNGLCGLSGVAHGLMAISAVEMLGGDRSERKIGWITLILVVGKGAFEAITGRMFFGFLDFGLLGNPVAVSHAGGILGGLVAALAAVKKKTLCAKQVKRQES